MEFTMCEFIKYGEMGNECTYPGNEGWCVGYGGFSADKEIAGDCPFRDDQSSNDNVK